MQELDFPAALAAFAATLPDDVIERDKTGAFAADAWHACADWGLIGMAVPKEFGGSAKGGIETGVAAMEALGYGVRDLGLVFGLSAQMWTVIMPLVEFGSDAQKAKYLPALCDGSMIGCHALTEPQSGSDIYSLQTRAEKVDGGYRLTGQKHLITLAPLADVALLFATTDPAKGRWGVQGFLVERDSPGYHAGPTRDKMGLRTVPIGEITLEDCFVPDENRIGAAGSGFGIAQRSLEFDRCCILAAQIGVMRRQVETAVQYARDRKQFGQAIGKFQSVSNRIADMALRLETSKLLLADVARRIAAGQPAALQSAMLKLHLSEAFVASSTDLIRIHGGTGYLSDTGVERDLRDAMGGVLYAGTSDIQRNIIAGLLGL
ncbi:MAG: acyl-CoA dehydrogenase family protein [Pseudomonadota bacterium]